MIPMRDGIHLHTIVFSPKIRKEALPFLIERSPYGWDALGARINAGMSELAKDGYFLVFQDIRGRYKSEGQFVMQRPLRTSKDSRSIDEGTDNWNSMDIESRRSTIRVRLNGNVVAESPGDPERAKSGPIGLQLHDRFSWVLFRNIRIREIGH